MKTASPCCKKAQIDMMETVMVLVVFFIILVLAIFFYYKFQMGSLKTTGEDLKLQKYSLLLEYIPSMSELKCTTLGQESECMDALKLLAFKDTLAKESYYKTLFQDTNISIRIVYPQSNSSLECSQKAFQSSDFPENCNYFTLYQSNDDFKTQLKISTPVSLYFPDSKEYKLAKLTIAIYQK